MKTYNTAATPNFSLQNIFFIIWSHSYSRELSLLEFSKLMYVCKCKLKFYE